MSSPAPRSSDSPNSEAPGADQAAVPSSLPDHKQRTTSPRWRRWAPWLLGAGALAGGWHWALSQGLPQWLPGKVQPLLAQELGTPVTWQKLEIQPWTLRVNLHGLHVGPQADPLLQVRSITVQPSWEVIWRWAPVLRRVTVEGPQVHIARLGPGQFNFSPMVAHWQQRHPPKPDDGAEPARFAIFNIALQDGAVHWRDEVLQQRHVVDQVQVGVPFLSNLASFVDAEVEPSLAARVDGSPLKIAGETLPFQQGKRSQVHVRWQDISVPQLIEAAQPFMPPTWRPQARTGTLATDLTVLFEAQTAPAVPRLKVSGSVTLDGLGLDWAGLPVALPQSGSAKGPGQGLDASLRWQGLALKGIDAQPLLRQVRVGELSVTGVQVQVRPGTATPAETAPVAKAAPVVVAAPPSGRPAETQTPAAPAAPWMWSVDQVKVQVNDLDVQPWAAPAGVKPLPRLQGLVATVKGLSADAKAKPAAWTLSWHDSAGGQLNAQGQAHAARAEATAQLDWQAWSLPDWSQLASQVLAAPVRLDSGQLSGKLHVNWAPTGARWDGGQLQVAQLLLSPASVRAAKVANAQPNRVGWRLLDVQGLSGHWAPPASGAQVARAPGPAAPEVNVQRISLQGLDAAVVRETGNRWFGMNLPDAGGEPQAKLVSNQANNQPAAKGASAAARPAAPPVRFILGNWQCSACRVLLDDRSVSPATRLALGPMQASLSGLDTARPEQPLRYEFDTRALDSGRIQAQGQVTLAPLVADAQVRTSRVELKVLQPYLDPYVNVVLMGAQPELDGHVRWVAPNDKQVQKLRYTGRLGLRELRLQDRVNAAEFLSWRQFGLESADVAITGDQVDARLGRINLQDFYGRIIVNPDGRLNLASVLRSERGGATTSVTTPQAPAAVPPAASGPASAVSVSHAAVAANAAISGAPVASAASASGATPPDKPARPVPYLSWQEVKLSGGRVDFTDHFIQPNYSARLTQVQGEVSAVSSRKPEPATLALSGAVDDAAPLRISGKVQPLGPQLFTDIEGSAKGIELSRLTPYAARYAGYGIDKGTLSVTVHYKVDQGKLEASNRIFLDQLTFGEASNSPDAVKLPIRFAVALLQNARGEIDLNLPISGSVNDPKFSIGGIIWQVVVNVITKAVTAPFSLLSGGDDGEDWGHVPFEAGSAELNDTARKRLEGLAKSLVDHPALKLEATGHAEVAADTLALRQAHLDGLMRAAKSRATGQPLADTRIAPAEVDTWLNAAYKAADITKPRNMLGLAKTLPPAEMRSMLMASAPVNDTSLRDLANARADQVKAYLSARIAPERVLLTASQVEPVAAQPKAGEPALPPSRVQMVLR